MARFIDPRVDKQEIEQKELGMGNFQGYPSLLRQNQASCFFCPTKSHVRSKRGVAPYELGHR